MSRQTHMSPERLAELVRECDEDIANARALRLPRWVNAMTQRRVALAVIGERLEAMRASQGEGEA